MLRNATKAGRAYSLEPACAGVTVAGWFEIELPVRTPLAGCSFPILRAGIHRRPGEELRGRLIFRAIDSSIAPSTDCVLIPTFSNLC